ncbi:MAG: hypothetical protein IT328_20080 [Caldilineaceae bacterium]|nr:hypothetical protein [Caldilineaceae bacterium]
MNTAQFSNEAELTAYIGLIAQAAELLDELALFIDDHGEVTPDQVSEIHVGNMTEVVVRLQNLKKFIRHVGGN